MILAASIWYWSATVGDCLSTNWNRDSRAARGLDPDGAEKNWLLRTVMKYLRFGSRNYWTVLRMVAGAVLWGWLVIESGATPLSDPLSSDRVAAIVSGLSAFVTCVVWYNSRKRFGLPWFW